MTAASAVTGRGWFHAVLGRWGWTLLGAVLLVAFLGLTALPMHQSAAPKWRMFQLQTWAMSGLLWWLLLGLPLVQSLHHMVALRLPGAWGVLLRGLALHGLLAVALPTLVAWLWPTPAFDRVSIAAVAAALWLGWACGVLFISLPVPLLPLAVGPLALCWNHLHLPAVSAAGGGLALLLLWGIWRWRLQGIHSPLLVPFGAWVAGSPMQLLERLQDAAAWPQRRRHGGQYKAGRRLSAPAAMPAPGRDLLAAMLGPSCQTFRQMWGRRGRFWVWLSMVLVVALLWALERWWLGEEKAGSFMLYFAIAMLIPTYNAAQGLHALRERQSAQWAELLLLPGMPSRSQLEGAVLRQVFVSQGERMVLLCLMGWAVAYFLSIHSLHMGWLLGVGCFGLVEGLYAAWLAWHGRRLHWLWSALLAGMVMGTANWGVAQQGGLHWWLLAVWAVYLLARLAYFAWQWRSIRAQPLPEGMAG